MTQFSLFAGMKGHLGAEEAFITLAPVCYPSNLKLHTEFITAGIAGSSVAQASGLFENPQAML